MAESTVRAFELSGEGAAGALDWLHVHADVLGALEGEHTITVWLAGALPPLPKAGVTVRELAFDPAAPAVTGLEHDAPIAVAPDLLVRPPWVERPAGFQGVELVVPRGGAFGSGEHGSTQAALRCLHALWDAPPSFGDAGTGSGILALYASVRGCASIDACDIDPACVRAARELLPGSRVHLGGADTLPVVDGLVANMTAAELRACLPQLLRAWSRRHLLVLGGLRANEVDELAASIPAGIAHREQVGVFTALGYRGVR